mmetsp:Transcript_31673/g.77667  ORF Transcript_31673/g.77667 Transcript_31673/m.77667 type:complete len:335 (+) Transcript_31673:1239-2243(+)
MIMLTQSSWITFSGDSVRMDAPTTAMAQAVRLTVSWNCRNLQMLSYTHRPHLTAMTMDAKLSSITMMSAAFCATCVPVCPMAKPTSARLSAGASLVPSPVTATVCGVVTREFWMPVTRVSLSRGEERASTRRWGQILSNSFWLIVSSALTTRSLKSIPVITQNSDALKSSSVRIPHLRAIAAAVRGLSPVTIRTTMPAAWHVATASGTSARTGSSRPMSPISTRSFSMLSLSSGTALMSRYAIVSVRSPWSANSPMHLLIISMVASSMGRVDMSSLSAREHSPSTISDAPLVNSRRPPSASLSFTSVLMRLRSEENDSVTRFSSSMGLASRTPQ